MMKSKTLQALALTILCSLLNACFYDNREELYPIQPGVCDLTAGVSYTADIIPIMEAHCIVCHNNGDPQGNVNLEGYTNILIYANNGSLHGSVAHTGNYSVMPPSGQKIPACDIDKIRLWVEAGAPDN